MYLAGTWYRLTVRPDKYNAADVMAALGVSILSDLVLQPILDIHDQRTDPRIAFVGGARGSGRTAGQGGQRRDGSRLYPQPGIRTGAHDHRGCRRDHAAQSHLVRTKIAQRPGRVQPERLIRMRPGKNRIQTPLVIIG